MFCGSISGEYGRHRGLFWEKDWETINGGSYSGIILPIVDDILQEYTDLYFQKDNAKGYASEFTQSVIQAAGIRVIEWPPFSPDLNPIETIWDNIKDYIQAHYPRVHISYKRLREAIQKAWESISHKRIRDLVRTMTDQCIDVILADGGYTKY
jgi:hypothetical protein